MPFEVRDRGETRRTDGAVSGSGTGRWTQARADLPAGTQLLRWRYTTDGGYLGRGVFVDDILVQGVGGVLLDGERTPEAFSVEGWAAVTRQAVA